MRQTIMVFVLLCLTSPLLAQQNAGSQATEEGVGPQPQHMFSIYFGGGSWYIDEAQLNDLATFIQGVPNIYQHEITIHSHTDNIGGAEYNAWLSEMRSEAAVYYLMQLQLPREMMAIKDFGQFNPVYDNATLEGRLKNRRVDIILWQISL